MKGCIHDFPKKYDFGITKNYSSISFNAIAVNIYICLLPDYIRPIMKKTFRKNQNDI